MGDYGLGMGFGIIIGVMIGLISMTIFMIDNYDIDDHIGPL